MFKEATDDLVIKKPRTFADESKKRGQNYYDYENNVNLVWSEGSIYACERKIGRGKYSEVFDSINLMNSQPCVVKMLKPSKCEVMQ